MTEVVAPSERYTVVSSDGHAGADLAEYRQYLPASYHGAFDEWLRHYVCPYEDLAGPDGDRNWNSERRLRELEDDGIVAEVVFPNTVPPFFSTSSLGPQQQPSGREVELRGHGLRAHNRWLADFCSAAPGRRAGVAQLGLHDLDAAVEEVRTSRDAGLRGVLLHGAPPGSGLPPLYDPEHYDRLWAACVDNAMPVHFHSGTGGPREGDQPIGHVMLLLELNWWDRRVLRHLILGGVLERFPQLRVVLTEMGVGWIPLELRDLNTWYDAMSLRGARSELSHGEEVARSLTMAPSEYWYRQCHVGASFLHPSEAALRDIVGVHTLMWGSDYPHYESSFPHSIDAIRLALAGVPQGEASAILGENAIELYDLDPRQLATIAEHCGPLRAEVGSGIDLSVLPVSAAKCPAFAGLVPESATQRWGDNRVDVVAAVAT